MTTDINDLINYAASLNEKFEIKKTKLEKETAVIKLKSIIKGKAEIRAAELHEDIRSYIEALLMRDAMNTIPNLKELLLALKAAANKEHQFYNHPTAHELLQKKADQLLAETCKRSSLRISKLQNDFIKYRSTTLGITSSKYLEDLILNDLNIH